MKTIDPFRPGSTTQPIHAGTLVLGDDASASADLAWLWVNCHSWPGWRVEVVTADATTEYRLDAERARLHEWDPPNPRQPFIESGIGETVFLQAGMDPRLALSRTTDLLVVGRRGPGLAKTLRLGSTAEWLMAHPPSPMVIARHGRATRHAVVCTDGSAHAVAAARSLARMPWIAGVTVTVAAVDDGHADVDAAIVAICTLFAGTGARVRRREARGEPTHELLLMLEDEQPDLVVLGTRGLTGLDRLRVGSTAGVVAHAVDCTVWLACDPTVCDPEPDT